MVILGPKRPAGDGHRPRRTFPVIWVITVDGSPSKTHGPASRPRAQPLVMAGRVGADPARGDIGSAVTSMVRPRSKVVNLAVDTAPNADPGPAGVVSGYRLGQCRSRGAVGAGHVGDRGVALGVHGR